MDMEYVKRIEFMVTMKELKRIQEFLTETFGQKFVDYRIDDPDEEPKRKIRRKENSVTSMPASGRNFKTQEISVIHLDGFEATPIKTEEEDDHLNEDLLPIVTSTQSFCQISPPVPLPMRPSTPEITPVPVHSTKAKATGLLSTKKVSTNPVPLNHQEVNKHKNVSPLPSANVAKDSTKELETDRTKNIAKTSPGKNSKGAPPPGKKFMDASLPGKKSMGARPPYKQYTNIVFPPHEQYVPPPPGTIHPRRYNRNNPVNPPQNGTVNSNINTRTKAEKLQISPSSSSNTVSPNSSTYLPTDDAVPSTSKACVAANGRKLASLRQTVRPPARLIANAESESENPIRCTRCYDLVYPSDLDMHNKTHHTFVQTPKAKNPKTPVSHKPVKKFDLTKRQTCSSCDIEFENFSKYEHHCKNDHPDEKTCPICKKSFGRRTNLLKHVESHEKKKFICDICGKAYNRNDNLQKHKRTEHEVSDIEPELFFCWYCTIAFASRAGRDKHLASHEVESEEDGNTNEGKKNDEIESSTPAKTNGAVAETSTEVAGCDEEMESEDERDD